MCKGNRCVFLQSSPSLLIMVQIWVYKVLLHSSRTGVIQSCNQTMISRRKMKSTLNKFSCKLIQQNGLIYTISRPPPHMLSPLVPCIFYIKRPGPPDFISQRLSLVDSGVKTQLLSRNDELWTNGIKYQNDGENSWEGTDPIINQTWRIQGQDLGIHDRQSSWATDAVYW